MPTQSETPEQRADRYRKELDATGRLRPFAESSKGWRPGDGKPKPYSIVKALEDTQTPPSPSKVAAPAAARPVMLKVKKTLRRPRVAIQSPSAPEPRAVVPELAQVRTAPPIPPASTLPIPTKSSVQSRRPLPSLSGYTSANRKAREKFMTLLWQVAPNGMACRADLEQVARETGRSPSRVTRIANILEHAGFLQWDWKESKYILDPLRKP